MQKIRVTKLFEFEAAHALYNYDGLCRSIHGHTYKLAVTLIGEAHKNDMVIDFSTIKNIVNKCIIDKFDHALLLNNKENTSSIDNLNKLFSRVMIVDFQPTVENMVVYFAELIKPNLPKDIKLFSIKMHETSNSYAEWFASDQD